MSHSPEPVYRRDIDGLRAIAVLAVVLYHFGVPGLSGGFVGVDVFFVISGFLITGIIQREIEQGRFTFAGFYERRIRRIFPALFVVLTTTLVAGVFILLPTDLIILGKGTLATLLFFSNILFWRTSGYFDSNSEINPLLHTWSLAVEEQFYIGLPILLIFVFRYARVWLYPILFFCAILSLFACIYVQTIRPTATFYLSPFRAWELLLGSYLAIGNLPKISTYWIRELLAWLGLVSLILSIVLIKAGPAFPGWQALAPVLGTGLLIYAGGLGQTVVGRILSLRPMVFIGLISYSLYLWHWPILVYSKYLNSLEPLDGYIYAGVAASIALSSLSYYFVETPFRVSKRIFTRRRLFFGAIAISLFLGGFSVFVMRSKGLLHRFSNEVIALDLERDPAVPFKTCDAKGIRQNQVNPDCYLGVKDITPSIIVWGDSHALSWAPALDAIFKEKEIAGILAFNSACPPLIGVINPVDPACHDENLEVIKYVADNGQLQDVLMVASWSSYSNEPGFYSIESDKGITGNRAVFGPALINTVLALQEKRRTVWLIGPTPGAPGDLPMKMAMTVASAKSTQLPNATSLADFRSQSSEFYRVATPIKNVSLINPTPWLCNEEFCQYEHQGLPLYRDGGHLNVRGALFLKSELASALESIGNK